MSPLIIPIAIEWVILVTTLAPMVLIGRFNRNPRLGLTLWFLTLLTAGAASALALSVAIGSILSTYVALQANPIGSNSWLLAIVASFAPWLILAIAGISLALVNQRLAPFVAQANLLTPLLSAAARPVFKFEGIQVSEIDLPVFIALAGRNSILISGSALAGLQQQELDAVLWHEVGHIRGRHNHLKQLAGFVHTLSPWFAASRALIAEVDRLAEIDADRFALRHVDAAVLTAAHSKFTSS